MTTSRHNDPELVPLKSGRLMTTSLERCASGEPLHDYVLQPYTPGSDVAGNLRSVNVLFEAFALAGVEREGRDLVETIRNGLGPHRTVWGIKHRIGEPTPASFEFYFYDFERRHADLSLARMKALVASSLTLDAEEPWPLPWHMFSFECSPTALRTHADVPADIYIDLRSYKLKGREFALENLYTFHDPRLQINELLQRLRSSVHFDAREDNLAILMPPSMFRCHRVCVAHKRAADAMYFSRVATVPTLDYLRAHTFPRALLDFIAHWRASLDHLQWDIGIDFDRRDGTPTVRRVGLYGSF